MIKITLSPACYKATLRDLGHAWENDWPQWNYRVKSTIRVTVAILTITGAGFGGVR